jgi:predicted membrane chloride channel (bestrophin family)
MKHSLTADIVISQILWIFVIGLPFQLCSVLSWATIPLCMVTSSFLFSLYYIGSEIEDPFGFDSNDLDVRVLFKMHALII